MKNIFSKMFYMDIQLDFGEKDGNQGIEMDVNKFKYTITLALKTLFGETSYQMPVDVLKYREIDRRGYIRVPSRCLDKVWNALLLFSRYDGQECSFRVYKVTPLLSCLNLNSRLYVHEIAEDCESTMND